MAIVLYCCLRNFEVVTCVTGCNWCWMLLLFLLVFTSPSSLSGLSLQLGSLLIKVPGLPLQPLSLLRLLRRLPVHPVIIICFGIKTDSMKTLFDRLIFFHIFHFACIYKMFFNRLILPLKAFRHLSHPGLLPLLLILHVCPLSPVHQHLVAKKFSVKIQ